nr:MAG: putative RNA-dependent RNA polymerase [Mitoviridae sp.]
MPLTDLLLWLTSAWRLRREFRMLTYRILQIGTYSGPGYLVQYLKEAHRLVMVSLAGTPESRSSSDDILVNRDPTGLPKIIPGSLRTLMRLDRSGSRNYLVIRGVLTVLSFYRIIKCKPILKLETITSPFKGLYKTVPQEELWRAIKVLPMTRQKLVWHQPRSRYFISESSGPNNKFASWGAPLDAVAFLRSPRTFLAYCKVSILGNKDWKSPLRLIFSCFITVPVLMLARLNSCYSLIVNRKGKFKFSLSVFITALSKWPLLAKIEQRIEPAGKVRLFAIIDIWSQWALKPLHDMLYSLLKQLPTDGTFDQTAPLNFLRERLRGTKECYSYDLSAATDRLPIDIQRDVISYFTSTAFSNAWANLLIRRSYHIEGQPLHYAVGQPMGAYSSWGSLALTHHVLVQVAAGRVGWKLFFSDYAVLGDDIVIADPVVAKAYFSLIHDLGVDISLAKSLQSKVGLMEFAKRLVFPHIEVTPIGPGVLLQAYRNSAIVPMLIIDALNKGVEINPRSVASMLKSLPFLLKLSRKKERLALELSLTGLLSPVTGVAELTDSANSFLHQRWKVPAIARAVVGAANTVVNIETIRTALNAEKAWSVWQEYWDVISPIITATPHRVEIPELIPLLRKKREGRMLEVQKRIFVTHWFMMILNWIVIISSPSYWTYRRDLKFPGPKFRTVVFNIDIPQIGVSSREALRTILDGSDFLPPASFREEFVDSSEQRIRLSRVLLFYQELERSYRDLSREVTNVAPRSKWGPEIPLGVAIYHDRPKALMRI